MREHLCQNPRAIATGHRANLCRGPDLPKSANFDTTGRLNPCLTPIFMPASPDDLFAFLDRHGIDHRTFHHAPMFTVEEGRDIVVNIPGGHTKNLFLKDKSGQLFLLVALQESRIDLKALPRLIGVNRLSFGAAELLHTHLGVTPGSVTPFAAMNDPGHAVQILLEERMMAHDILNFHPLINTMTTSIARGDLMRFFDATGHRAQIVAAAQSGG